MLDGADTRSLALLYHLNSEPWATAAAYEARPQQSDAKDLAGVGPRVPLDPPSNGSPLERLILQRTSCRSWTGEAISLGDVGSVLGAMYGATRVLAFPDGIEIDVRTVPSAGGLYPLELYILADHVEGLPQGLYHYARLEHALVPLRMQVRSSDLDRVMLLPELVDGAAAVVFVAAVFDRTLHKYAARGYRYVLLEAGHAAQNGCLRATELGLGSLCLGGFRDAGANRLLELDPRCEGVVYSVAVGRPA
jgi:SagB-type dehydrogenase family enzyme